MDSTRPGDAAGRPKTRACLALLAAGGLAMLAAPALAAGSAQQSPAAAPAASSAETSRVPARVERGLPQAVGVNVDTTDDQLANANKNRQDWLLYGRTYTNQRFSPLTQINDRNVQDLHPVTLIQTGVAKTFETNPIEVNGILFVSTADDHILAYDAVTGRQLWSYVPQLNFTNLCCGPENRGVAVAYGRVFFARLDAHLMALDAHTGKVLWDTPVADSRAAYSLTMAPQVYNGMIIVGSAGAEYPTRGFVAAYDAKTGKQIWRFATTAAPGQPGGDSWSGDSWKTGGGSVWNTPAIDRKNGLVLFGVGNPNPDNDGSSRQGANAYTCAIVAIHAKDGTLAWYYQESPHDLWDYDATGPVVLLNAMENGKMVPAAAEAGKVGQVFIVERTTGKLIRKSEPFVRQSSTMWTKPGEKPVLIYPGAQGGNEWSPEAFSPKTRDMYVMGTNEAWIYTAKTQPTLKGALRLGGVLKPITDVHPDNTIPPTGTLSAVNVDTGKIDWQYQAPQPMLGGVTATAGNLVFAGEMNGDFDAFDARTGRKLWHFSLGAGVNAPPITYEVGGRQYVAVAAGGNAANGNPQLMKEIGRHFGDTIAIFALNERVAAAR